MMPKTHNDLPAMACLSAMQKCIRRGGEEEAMQFACELIHSSKAYHSMVCRRLEIISHEDIDTAADPRIVPFVAAACAQAMRWYDPQKIGASRMCIGNAIRMMCRAQKSREGDHFGIAFGLANQIGGYVPSIPDFAYDHHTHEGRRRGRGLDFFRKESTKLVPPVAKDQYEDRAYKMLALKMKQPKTKTADDLFEE